MNLCMNISGTPAEAAILWCWTSVFLLQVRSVKKNTQRPIFFFFFQQLIRYAEHTHPLVLCCCQAAKTPCGSGGISVLRSGSDWVIACSGAWHRSPTAPSAGSASVLLALCYTQVKSPETSSHPKCPPVTILLSERMKVTEGIPCQRLSLNSWCVSSCCHIQ